MFRRFLNTIRQALAHFGRRHREPQLRQGEPVLETFSDPAVVIETRPKLPQSPAPGSEDDVLIPFSEPAVHFEVKPRRTEQ
jgi:hypothetical protein